MMRRLMALTAVAGSLLGSVQADPSPPRRALAEISAQCPDLGHTKQTVLRTVVDLTSNGIGTASNATTYTDFKRLTRQAQDSPAQSFVSSGDLINRFPLFSAIEHSSWDPTAPDDYYARWVGFLDVSKSNLLGSSVVLSAQKPAVATNFHYAITISGQVFSSYDGSSFDPVTLSAGCYRLEAEFIFGITPTAYASLASPLFYQTTSGGGTTALNLTTVYAASRCSVTPTVSAPLSWHEIKHVMISEGATSSSGTASLACLLDSVAYALGKASALPGVSFQSVRLLEQGEGKVVIASKAVIDSGSGLTENQISAGASFLRALTAADLSVAISSNSYAPDACGGESVTFGPITVVSSKASTKTMNKPALSSTVLYECADTADVIAATAVRDASAYIQSAKPDVVFPDVSRVCNMTLYPQDGDWLEIRFESLSLESDAAADTFLRLSAISVSGNSVLSTVVDQVDGSASLSNLSQDVYYIRGVGRLEYQATGKSDGFRASIRSVDLLGRTGYSEIAGSTYTGVGADLDAPVTLGQNERSLQTCIQLCNQTPDCEMFSTLSVDPSQALTQCTLQRRVEGGALGALASGAIYHKTSAPV